MNNVNPGQVQKYLSGLDFPANKQKLIEHAEEQGAPKEVVDVLNKLPDKSFGGMDDILPEITRLTEVDVDL
jgi:hypothetical protein